MDSLKRQAGMMAMAWFLETYFMRFDCWESEPTMSRPVGKSFIPQRYNDRESSPIKEIVIEPDSRQIDLGVINIEST